MNQTLTLYWIKRDFRLLDNIALTKAIEESDQVVPIFILEPSFLNAPDTSVFHVHAVIDALQDLRHQLQQKGTDVAVIKGEVIPVLDTLYQKKKFHKIVSHEEIGTERTYGRDRAVNDWCTQYSVEWTEVRQTGVFRRLTDRDKRHKEWKRFMFSDIVPVPKSLKKCVHPEEWSTLFYEKNRALTFADTPFQMTSEQQQYVQAVNETAALQTMQDFLQVRGFLYRGGISSPVIAFTAGSRMSVHLAWGTITGRVLYQATQARMDELQQLKDAGDPYAGRWRMSLRSFTSRLHWRDHFIQRLEREPEMEFRAINPAYEQLEYDNAPEFLQAWNTGMTGYPMVDACIRCLHTTGFINFRMRAMLTSFACHTLHLDWKIINHPMARMYTDYEPGIHLSQLQMQAGVVGINTLRIYSPTKQIIDQDPETVFIKKWIPELRPYSIEAIVGHEEEPVDNYPAPVVDRKVNNKEMRRRVYAIRKIDGYREIANRVYEKHGSRRSGSKKKKPVAKKT